MITTIHEGSKAIIQYVLNEAITACDLHKKVKITREDACKKLGFPSGEHFDVCIQYLKEKGLIHYYTAKNNPDFALDLTISAIDFLETD